MEITDLLLAPGLGGFFNDDQLAIRNGAVRDGEYYQGAPVTRGFSSVRVPATCVSIGLLLDDGFIAWGDMMSVQYAAASGRDPLFRTDIAGKFVRKHVSKLLVGRTIRSFREIAGEIAALRVNNRPVHTGIQYGLSQAVLQAAAHAAGQTMVEQICDEFSLSLLPKPVPVYAQSGDLRYENVDKMIMKSVDVLPHGLINNIEKFGRRGETFIEYVRWVATRISDFGRENYDPVLYFDVYGMPGMAFDNNFERISEYLCRVAEAASPYRLRIESPVSMDTLQEQIDGFAGIKEGLAKSGNKVEIAVDEWCNTLEDIEQFINSGAVDLVQVKLPDMGGIQLGIEAMIRCHQVGVGAYLGGSCTETDLSSRMTVHIGIATQATMMLAKPGMGVDEAIMIVGNEQSRTLAVLNNSRKIPCQFQ